MKPRQRKCRECGEWYMPFNSLQKTCTNPACAISHGKQLQRKERRRETRKARERLKTRGDVQREAQAAFNAYIRERDADKPCICCGRWSTDSNLITGSRWDAGHYRSTGAAPHLRFNEDNCHRQMVYCNQYLSGNIPGYRKGLIERIGIERVEALEADNSVKKWTKQELEAIRDEYRRKARELKKERE